MIQLPEKKPSFPVLALEFDELERLSKTAKQWTPEERLAHLGKLRRAYYGDDRINGKIEKIMTVIDTATNEVIETIDCR